MQNLTDDLDMRHLTGLNREVKSMQERMQEANAVSAANKENHEAVAAKSTELARLLRESNDRYARSSSRCHAACRIIESIAMQNR